MKRTMLAISARLALSNLIVTFGPRILELTWSEVNEWKRQNMLGGSIKAEHNDNDQSSPTAIDRAALLLS